MPDIVTLQSGLARLHSNTPFPQQPRLRATRARSEEETKILRLLSQTIIPELENAFRGIEQYLKDLSGKFTATNIINQIGTSGVFCRQYYLKYKGDDGPTLTGDLDTSIDFRQYAIVASARNALTVDELNIAANAPAVAGNQQWSATTTWNFANNDGSDYAIFSSVGDASVGQYSLYVDGTSGKLKYDFTRAGAGSKTMYIAFTLIMSPKLSESLSDYTSFGNGN